jgi:photosystem II stability/assembly factor-like uncharacterized protein
MKPLHKLVILFLLLNLSACFELPQLQQQSPTPPPPTATPNIVQPPPTLPPLPTATLAIPLATSETPASISPAAPYPALVDISMFDPQNGWGQSEEGLYRTRDGGQTWQAVSAPLPEGYQYNHITCLDINNAYITASDPQNPPVLLLLTRDGGQTWGQAAISGRNPSFPALIQVDEQTLFLFEGLGVGAGSQGIAISRSTDGGQTWEETFAHQPGSTTETSLPLGGLKSLPAFLDASLGFIGGSRPVENDIYFFRTEDGGRTWQPQSLPVPASINGYMAMTQNPITFRNDNQTLIAPVLFSLPQGDPQLVFFHSPDRGQTWSASTPLAYGGAYFFLNPQTAWVWADGALYTSRDGGLSWLNLGDPLPDGASINRLSFVDSENGWALVFEPDFQTRLYATHDGGQTWARLTP